MNKLNKIISSLNEEDLLKIKRDLNAGNVDKLVEKRLASFKETDFSSKICPVCNNNITNESLVLEFGKNYFRKRAYFDGADCLEYFVKSKLRHDANDDLKH